MYLRYADERHLPIVCISESSKPTRAAVEAAPIRKLCPVCRHSQNPGARVLAGDGPEAWA